jgi:ferredoxin-NADP reductase
VGAGVGITPVRALLEELPRDTDVVVILRGSKQEDLVLRDEIAHLVARRGGRLHELVGPRERVPLDSTALAELAPDIAERDVYLCGPEPFQDAVVAAATEAGVPASHLHHESFSF